uniref:Rab-GAP TBC domain-containing protein n=1 Tax=Romanomermis culicivorax TaxID=13658 RepID=A0A915HX36_ROMCU
MFKYFRRRKEHEYIRIHVTIGDRPSDPGKKFCIDPQVTDLHTVRQLIHLAFDINRALIIKWVTYDDKSLPILKVLNTDHDFRKALRVGLTHELLLRVDYDQTAEEYNVMEYHRLVPDQGSMQYVHGTTSGDQFNLLEQARSVSYMYLNLENSLAGAVCSSGSTSTEHALTESNAKSLSDNFSTHGSTAKVADLYAISNEPLTKLKFDQMFDVNGRMTFSYSAFKLAVYQGGVEPSIRPAVWRFLLNVVDYRSTDGERKAQMESY